ncbi:L-threonine-O-3-phosphate decarboxylase [Rippkaea orientalis PCC 8801]|uniref:threonine-phosphate decarboxylase n=1 Tax=Rippkaea orientalis (strain PCC 8801 / RF-1) TaxID=41431 RepID=B7JW87_RIPO1|nr:threonine-phosphate decarboxylase CobD [Rippkaea orientalis]ACK66932.1 L-threonine-O-3-phosphate decarboxylase [Rippkaea orientalis PCC 8801]
MTQPIHGGNIVWAASQVSCPISSILDFSASINPLGPPQGVMAVLSDAISQITHYPDPDYRQLRRSLADYHHISPDWIIPGNGAAELLTWAGRELAQYQTTYLLVPAFRDYWRALRSFGAQVTSYPFPWDDDPGTLTLTPINPQSSGIIINNPHNPTGKLFSRETLLPLLEKFALVVIDEAFMDFLAPDAEQSLIALVSDYPNLVVLRSLTKFYSIPGLRLGYAIAHPSRLEQWQGWRDPWSVNSLAARIGEIVIKDQEFQQQTWQWLTPTRNALFEGLSHLQGLQPFKSSANFLLVKTAISSLQLQQELLQKHQILIRDCLSFPELGDRYFRIAVRTDTENERLLEALEQI